jgi:3,4-dihydroxy 2-butanone 4-phosphate synthase / GTP cyclohydrolase II
LNNIFGPPKWHWTNKKSRQEHDKIVARISDRTGNLAGVFKMDGALTMPRLGTLRNYISSTAEIIDEARAGRVFILVDDEDRENEGDLVIPAQFATPDAINFMAKYARGLICLAMTKGRSEYLGLPLMSKHNGSRHETAFTVSIEARDGVTTGISAADRARTVAVAINAELGREDLVTPGHIFPLVARDGGTLVRAGHTEAAVDIARLAGLIPAGVICEIMNDDGTMARLPDLVAFAQTHNLKLGSISDLIAYRRHTEKVVKRVEQAMIVDRTGNLWNMIAYQNQIDKVEHVALTKGILTASEPILVRMHAVDTIHDLLGGNHTRNLHEAMQMVQDAKCGVVVLIRESSSNVISESIRLLAADTHSEPSLREYGIGAQILLDIGVKSMILLSNHKRTVVGLDGYGLNIVEQRNITRGEMLKINI